MIAVMVVRGRLGEKAGQSVCRVGNQCVRAVAVPSGLAISPDQATL